MASGRWITHRVKQASVAIVWIAACAHAASAKAGFDQKNPAVDASCKPVYLTLDTGHMEVAPLIADVLKRHQVKVTFFAANERTKTGDGSLGTHWASWWKARAAEGHEFASHTYDHTYWRADVPGAPGTAPQFRVRPSAGPSEGKDFKKALRDIQPGDILLAHLGIWSRKDPWAPAVLEPLITGLQSRGFCFKTLREHPQYKAWFEVQASAAHAQTGK